MAMNYKLVQKAMPGKPEAPKKWYAVPKSSTPMTGKAMTRAATANTTTAPIEMEAALELLAAFVPQQLKQGHTIKLPGLGSFRLTFKSEGVENIDDFQASTMIKEPRIVFTPDKELRNSVLTGLTFEDGGVLEGDVSYASLADYRHAKASGTIPSEPGEDEPVIQ